MRRKISYGEQKSKREFKEFAKIPGNFRQQNLCIMPKKQLDSIPFPNVAPRNTVLFKDDATEGISIDAEREFLIYHKYPGGSCGCNARIFP
jgi:hypothetical protein